jgi:hypothetical protein
MWEDLPMPFMVGAIKVWPVHARAEFSHFLAFEGKPMYFTSKAAAILFAKDAQSAHDFEGLCD